MLEMIQREIEAQKAVLDETLNSIGSYIYTACIISMDTLASEKKILTFGNGGCQLQSLQLASNIVGHYKTQRRALSAVCLQTSINGIDGDDVFSRQVEALAQDGDLLISFSLDGQCSNIVKALEKGKELGCRTVGLSGFDGGMMDDYCDVNVIVPSSDRARIVEVHTLFGHILVQSIDNAKL